jgi:spore germination cell wall hydrolase CwlJ-like protein
VTREQLRSVLSDQTALIATLLGEAANEPVEGQIAVACVVRNRARHPRWWGRSIRGVCVAKSQFSCWFENNTNTERVYALADALHRRQDATGPLSVVGQLHWIAAGVIDDMLLDNTGGADHYLTRALYQSAACPTWAKGRAPVATHGAHVFLRLEL